MSGASQVFFEEAKELLAVWENAMLAIDQGDTDPARINEMFRAAHTIKGGAGLFGLNEIVEFTHVVENFMDLARNGQIQLESSSINVLLACQDFLQNLVQRREEGLEPDEEVEQSSKVLLDQLRPLTKTGASAPVSAPKSSAPAKPKQAESKNFPDQVDSEYWHISLVPTPEVFHFGMDPASFIRYLDELGRIHLVRTWVETPAWDEFDPDRCYYTFEISFESGATKEDIEEVFEFISEGSKIRIIPPHSRIGEYQDLLQTMPGKELMLGELLVACGTLTQKEMNEALGIQETQRREIAEQKGAAEPEKIKLGDVLVQEKMVHPEVVKTALNQQKQAPKKEERRSVENKFLKIEASKLDSLINLVGELVIAGSGASQLARLLKHNPMMESTEVILDLVERIRDTALNLRMVPMGEVFQRFPRVVRDTAKELGKQIDLQISGAETELDKGMVEKLADPLTHIVRNAMDHGLESVEDRIAAGKDATGILKLHAYHESGSVVIEVRDDGRGLNKDRILSKAIEKGLVAPGADLTDSEIYRLIFEPGFSTAEQVTNLSGRGVGMDVVKSTIEGMRGFVEIESNPGFGSCFKIRLPLTLAIIDGFLVSVGEIKMVLPQDMVLECIQLPEEHDPMHDFVNLRGEVLPFVQLNRLLQVPSHPNQRQNIVVVQYGTFRAGVVVDRLHGGLQAVIKPLGEIFTHLKGLGGSTVLGSGEVALMLDIPEIIGLAQKKDRRAVHKHLLTRIET